MFYSQFILAKKGPLGTIWIAAHLERKLRKNQVADTDIGVSVDSIIFPDVPIALRLSSHLLLGVVRIYSRKVNYLFDDCSETLLKIKQAFRSAAVDLPPEESKAPYHSITLPETFDLDDFELPDTENFQGNYVDHHVSAKEQITLQDTMEGVVFSTSQFGLDERFGDEETCQIGLDLNEDALFEKNAAIANDEPFNSDPQGSVHPMTPLDPDADNNEITESSKLLLENYDGLQMEGLERNYEPTDFAEAPSTPMLVEEANLSCVQDARASDEHVECEVPNLAEPFPKEGGRHISATDIVNDPLSGEMTTQQDEVQLAQDCTASVLSVNDANSVPLPYLDHDDLDKPMSLESHHADYLTQNLGGADDSSAVVWNVETPSCILSQTAARSEELVEAKSNGALEQEKCDPDEVAETMEELLAPEKAPAVYQFDAALGLPGLESSKMGTPEDLSNDKERDRRSNFGLQACSSKIRHQEDTSFAEVEKDCTAVDVVELDSNDQPKDKCNMNLDLSAPEKLLSVPTELADKPKNLLSDFTPYKEYSQEGMANNLTESVVPLQSNPLVSSGLIQSKNSMQSVPDDDDLLSSILVGRRSSVLKMNPSPVPLTLTPAKRLRTSSRASSSKRKVLMDESMVLHGDVIRLQLINTDDLRRARKKAPCTLSEISILQRQFLEDEIFSETTHSGMSKELSYMQKRVYDLSRLKICDLIEPISPTAKKIHNEPNLSKGTNKDENEDPMSIGDGDEVRVVEPLTENHHDNSLTSGSHTIQFEVETLHLECNGRIDAMDIDEETVARVETVNNTSITSFDDLVPVDPGACCLSVNIDSNIKDKEGDAVEVDAFSDIALKTECFEKTPSAVELITEEGLNSLAEPCDVTQSEHPSLDFHVLNGLSNGALDEIKIDSPTDHCLMASHDVEVSAVTALAGGVGWNNMNLEESSEAAGAVHEIESHSPLSVHVVDEAAVTGNCSEPRTDFVQQLEHEADVVCASLLSEEIADVNDSHRGEDLQTTNDFDDLENLKYGNDTEFLNVDDDEVDHDNEHVADGQESLLLDNTGWSSRTRAVAKYLQMLFDKDGVRGSSVLEVDNLLAGKTRKEASRMFFESLVLKTKDYIHVEQEKPFDNITLRPRGKLMKSIF